MHKITHIGSWRILSIVACGACMRTRSHRAARASVQSEKNGFKNLVHSKPSSKADMCVRRISSPCSCCSQTRQVWRPCHGHVTISLPKAVSRLVCRYYVDTRAPLRHAGRCGGQVLAWVAITPCATFSVFRFPFQRGEQSGRQRKGGTKRTTELQLAQRA